MDHPGRLNVIIRILKSGDFFMVILEKYNMRTPSAIIGFENRRTGP